MRRALSPAGAEAPERRLTSRQREVARAIVAGHDCRISANAGAGKTATILAACEELPGDVRVLFLTYNRELKADVQQRVAASAALRQVVQATNFDSLLVQYYDSNAPFKDFGLALLEVLQHDGPPSAPLSFDVLVVDEAQDLDPTFLAFLRKLQRDNDRPTVQLVSIGDPKQTIYRYRGASPALFLQTGDAGLHRAPPLDFELGATFRFGQAICDVVDALGARLFAGGPYLPHTPATARTSGVRRYVLPLDRHAVPTALLAHLTAVCAADEEPTTWIAGSTRSSNVRLWDVVEALGLQDELVVTALSPEQLRDRPIAGLAAYVKTAHSCKGKTFASSALFLTNRQTWIDGKLDTVAPEILYVALTRAAGHLVLVESADSMIFQDVVVRLGLAGHAAIPPALCAVTGAPLTPPAPAQPPSSWTPLCMAEALAGAGGRSKHAMLETVAGAPLGPWPAGPAAALAPLGPLGCRAVWLRVEHARGERLAAAGLWQALVAPTAPEQVYAQFFAADRNRLHRLTPGLRRALAQLLAAGPLAAFGWAQWLQLARFSAAFNYGHAALPPSVAADEEVCERHLQRVLAALAARPEARVVTRMLRDTPLDAPGLYADAAGVLLLVAEDCESERAADRLLAATAAAVLDVAAYAIYYVQQDRHCQGELPPEARAQLKRHVAQLTGR